MANIFDSASSSSSSDWSASSEEEFRGRSRTRRPIWGRSSSGDITPSASDEGVIAGAAVSVVEDESMNIDTGMNLDTGNDQDMAEAPQTPRRQAETTRYVPSDPFRSHPRISSPFRHTPPTAKSPTGNSNSSGPSRRLFNSTIVPPAGLKNSPMNSPVHVNPMADELDEKLVTLTERFGSPFNMTGPRSEGDTGIVIGDSLLRAVRNTAPVDANWGKRCIRASIEADDTPTKGRPTPRNNNALHNNSVRNNNTVFNGGNAGEMSTTPAGSPSLDRGNSAPAGFKVFYPVRANSSMLFGNLLKGKNKNKEGDKEDSEDGNDKKYVNGNAEGKYEIDNETAQKIYDCMYSTPLEAGDSLKVPAEMEFFLRATGYYNAEHRATILGPYHRIKDELAQSTAKANESVPCTPKAEKRRRNESPEEYQGRDEDHSPKKQRLGDCAESHSAKKRRRDM